MAKLIMSKGKTINTTPVNVNSGANYKTDRGAYTNKATHFGVADRGMKYGGHVKAMLGKMDK
jgi:hypothetical protein